MDRHTALQVFRHVADLNGFAAAGRAMGLSPAAVSKNVTELEAHLGVRLFNRTTRRMSLTGEGQMYLAHVARGLDALAEGEQVLQRGVDEPTGLLRVSAPLTVSLMRLSSAIPAFLLRHPTLRLDLDLNDRRVDIVRDGFDLAVRASDHLEDSSLVARRLGEMHYVVCASPAYFAEHGIPRVPDDLRLHRIVRFSLSSRSNVWEFTQNKRSVKVPLDAHYAVNTSLAMRDAMLAGYGLSLIPYPYVEADVKAGRLQTVLADWSTSHISIYAVYPSREHLAPKVRVFIDFLAENF